MIPKPGGPDPLPLCWPDPDGPIRFKGPIGPLPDGKPIRFIKEVT